MTFPMPKRQQQPQQPPEPITPAMRKKAEDILRKGKVQLAINHAFFGQIALNRKISVVDNISTACIDRRGYIKIGTRFLAGLTVQNVVFLLAHESMHYALIHLLRRSYRDPRKWNVACDAVINDLLIEAKVGDFIEGGVNMPGSKVKTSEKVYDELPENDDGDGKGPSGGSSYSPGDGFDDLDEQGDGPPLSESEMREIEEQARVEVAAAAQVAKMQGKMPAALEKVVDEIINPRTPWHQLLERFMTNFVSSGISWRRPNRRLLTHNLYLPSTDKEPRMGAVGIYRDSSGSCMDNATQAHFLGHINSIIEKCRPERVYVIDCDAQVEKVREYTLDDLPILPGTANPMGGGGTSFAPPFRYIEEQGIELDVAIYLTDMIGDFPDEAPPYPTIWLSTSDVKEAPFGEVIQYECTE